MRNSSSKLLKNIYFTQCVASKNTEVHQGGSNKSHGYRMTAKKSDKSFSKSTRLWFISLCSESFYSIFNTLRILQKSINIKYHISPYVQCSKVALIPCSYCKEPRLLTTKTPVSEVKSYLTRNYALMCTTCVQCVWVRPYLWRIIYRLDFYLNNSHPGCIQDRSFQSFVESETNTKSYVQTYFCTIE